MPDRSRSSPGEEQRETRASSRTWSVTSVESELGRLRPNETPLSRASHHAERMTHYELHEDAASYERHKQRRTHWLNLARADRRYDDLERREGYRVQRPHHRS